MLANDILLYTKPAKQNILAQFHRALSTDAVLIKVLMNISSCPLLLICMYLYIATYSIAIYIYIFHNILTGTALVPVLFSCSAWFLLIPVCHHLWSFKNSWRHLPVLWKAVGTAPYRDFMDISSRFQSANNWESKFYMHVSGPIWSCRADGLIFHPFVVYKISSTIFVSSFQLGIASDNLWANHRDAASQQHRKWNIGL